jgi:hypothetical protein
VRFGVVVAIAVALVWMDMNRGMVHAVHDGNQLISPTLILGEAFWNTIFKFIPKF